LIKSFMRYLKRKPKEKILTTELIEQKALERVMPLAREKAKEQICQDCRDQRCLTGSECKAFNLLSKTYAIEMIVEKAELN